jgi:hypothetical protein
MLCVLCGLGRKRPRKKKKTNETNENSPLHYFTFCGIYSIVKPFYSIDMTSTSINNEQYHCLCCNYSTCHKGDFNKHNLTSKHIKRIACFKEGSHVCLCGKAYKHSSSLTKHKHKCGVVLKSQHGELPGEIDGEKNASFLLEIRNLIVDQHRELIALIEKIAAQTKFSNIQLHSSSSSQPDISPQETTFNLHSFLNENCKHSINMKEFIESLKVNFADLENTGKYGFIKSMSQFITRELGKLDVYTRPIHCSDVSRKVLYIKNEDIWQKDTDAHVMTKKIISSMNHKMNVSQILDWKNAHPTCEYSDDKLNTLYLKIIRNSMGDDDAYEKIITHLSEKIAINKKNPQHLH